MRLESARLTQAHSHVHDIVSTRIVPNERKFPNENAKFRKLLHFVVNRHRSDSLSDISINSGGHCSNDVHPKISKSKSFDTKRAGHWNRKCQPNVRCISDVALHSTGAYLSLPQTGMLEKCRRRSIASLKIRRTVVWHPINWLFCEPPETKQLEMDFVARRCHVGNCHASQKEYGFGPLGA